MELVIALFASGFLYQIGVTQGQKDEWDRCSSNAMVLTMSACQESRHKLSLASQTNDTVKLCTTLQRYSDCMAPRLEGCKGAARMAFDVIRTKYATHYNCRVMHGSNNQQHGESHPHDSFQNYDPALFINPNQQVGLNTVVDGPSRNSSNTANNTTGTRIATDLLESTTNTKGSNNNNTTITNVTQAPSTTIQLNASSMKNKTDQEVAAQNQTTTRRPVFDPSDNGTNSFLFHSYLTSTLISLASILVLKSM